MTIEFGHEDDGPFSGPQPECPTCEGDGYIDLIDDETGGVIGPAPCPGCGEEAAPWASGF